MSEQTEIKVCGFAHNADIIGTMIMQAVRNNNIDMLNKICKEMKSLPDDIESFMTKQETSLGDVANYIFAAGAAYTLLELADNLSQEARTIKMIASQQNEKKNKIVDILLENEPSMYQDCLRLSEYDKEEFDSVISEMIKDDIELIDIHILVNHRILWLTKVGREYAMKKRGAKNDEN